MAWPLLVDIALTHLAGRKRQTAVSVLGAALGVGFFIAIAALMQGFQQDFLHRVIESAPHITLRDEFRDPPRQPAAIRFPDAALQLRGVKPLEETRGIKNGRRILGELAQLPGMAVAPTLEGQVFLRYGSRDVSAALIGIEPERERRVTQLEEDLTEGTLGDLARVANGIILGTGLARKLGAATGDSLTAVSPADVTMRVEVVGLFRTGMQPTDDGQAYMLLRDVQILQDRPNVINRIRIRLADVYAAREVASRIEARYGYRAVSWQEASENIFNLFVIQNVIMYSTTGAILVVAAFGIFNIISTVVYEKARDIAILKSLGFAERDVRRIFLLQGLLVGLAGALLGWAVGYGLTLALASIRLGAGIGMRQDDRLILSYSFTYYWLAALFALLAAGFAAWLPARKAARLHPVDIIRGAT
jgi:lipoprotein-releasing system permease protein